MELEECLGDVLSEKKGIIVHGCNAQGKFASGIAGQIRSRYPAAYLDYMQAYHQGDMKVGDIVVTKITDDKFIISAITQEFYGTDKSVVYLDYNSIPVVFNKSVEVANEQNLPLLFPKIGCGLANGKWERVCSLIEESIDGLNSHLTATVYTL